MRMRSRSGFSLMSFFAGLGMSGLCLVWLWPALLSQSASTPDQREQRYLQQINTLKHALSQSTLSFSRERKLAARLQQELRDANGQIDELARDMAVLRAAVAQSSRNAGGVPDRRATLRTNRSFIVNRSRQQLTNGQFGVVKAQAVRVSPYAPRGSSRAVARKTIVLSGGSPRRELQRRTAVKVSSLRSLRRDPRQTVVNVALLASEDVGSIAGGAQATALALAPGLAQQNSHLGASESLRPKPVTRPVRERRRVRKSRFRRRSARFQPRTRLGRLQRRRGRSVRRYRSRRRGSLYNRMARRGVFGEGNMH